MTRRRLVTELGRGTDLQGRDYTKAAVRALRDALHRNSLTVAPALGYPREAMEVEITIGVARPDEVDREAILAVLPYGRGSVEVVRGGLDVPADEGDGMTVIANAAAVVWLDIDDGGNDVRVPDAESGSANTGIANTGSANPGSANPGGSDTGSADAVDRRSPGDEASTVASPNATRAPAGANGAPFPRRIILESGMGADLRGEDVTKAARRAVRDALYHSSIALFGSLGIAPSTMAVEIRIGVQRPEAMDLDAVASEAPHGDVTVVAEPGGLDVVYADIGTRIVVASAAVIARLPLPEGRFATGRDEP